MINLIPLNAYFKAEKGNTVISDILAVIKSSNESISFSKSYIVLAVLIEAFSLTSFIVFRITSIDTSDISSAFLIAVSENNFTIVLSSFSKIALDICFNVFSSDIIC